METFAEWDPEREEYVKWDPERGEYVTREGERFDWPIYDQDDPDAYTSLHERSQRKLNKPRNPETPPAEGMRSALAAMSSSARVAILFKEADENLAIELAMLDAFVEKEVH
jgi:hypothetical protein